MYSDSVYSIYSFLQHVLTQFNITVLRFFGSNVPKNCLLHCPLFDCPPCPATRRPWRLIYAKSSSRRNGSAAFSRRRRVFFWGKLLRSFGEIDLFNHRCMIPKFLWYRRQILTLQVLEIFGMDWNRYDTRPLFEGCRMVFGFNMILQGVPIGHPLEGAGISLQISNVRHPTF